MRFAVHRPGNPVASPRSHGVPRRDVPGRVHVSVAGVTAGSAPEDGLALARLPVHLPARRAPLARERGFDLLHPAGRLVLQPAHQQAPPRPQDAPVQPGLLRGRSGPGSPRVPFADRVMFLICRSSTRITSNRRAMSVLAFSAQSLRRSVSRALQPGDRVPAPGRGGSIPASRGRACAPAAAAWSAPARSGRGRAAVRPVDRAAADRHAPVDAHGLAVTGCGNRLGDHGEGDMPAPARSIVTR